MPRKVKVDLGVLITLRDAAQGMVSMRELGGYGGLAPPTPTVNLALKATERHVPAPGAPARARRGDPSTSQEAADSLTEEGITNRERQVLEALEDVRTMGRTSTELASILREPSGQPTPRDSITPRIRPLVERGLVFRSDERRPGPSGRANSVWKITPAGTENLRALRVDNSHHGKV